MIGYNSYNGIPILLDVIFGLKAWGHEQPTHAVKLLLEDLCVHTMHTCTLRTIAMIQRVNILRR